jgi:hypothetical protein
LFADRSDEANAQFALGMWHDDDATSLRMNEHVVRTPDSFQGPTGLLQLADKVSAPHVCIIHTTSTGTRSMRPPRIGVAYPITCIVIQVAADAGFCVPSTSTLTS